MKPGDLVSVGHKHCSVPLYDTDVIFDVFANCRYIDKREPAPVIAVREFNGRWLVLLMTTQGLGWVNEKYTKRLIPSQWCK